MKSNEPMLIELTPEMAEIVERLRGKMSPQAYLNVLLNIASSAALIKPPNEGIGAQRQEIKMGESDIQPDKPRA